MTQCSDKNKCDWPGDVHATLIHPLMGISEATEREAILTASHLCRLACRLLRMNHSAYLTSQIICTQYLYRHKPFLPKSTISDPENRVNSLVDVVLASSC